MSIATSLTKLETDITSAYNAVQTKGGTIPSDKNTDNLATAINSISGGGGGSTLITKSITENGTYNASSDNVDGYSQVTVNVSGGTVTEPVEKDVNFYDYDGARLYSYTKTEFLALNSFPEAPTHLLLTSDGWNWGLTNAKNYVEEYGGLDIGHTYHSTDGATKIFIDLEGRLDPYVGIRARGTVYVDWGDGSEVQTITKSSYGEIGRHTYAREGSYIISISPSDSNATIQFTGSSSSNDGSHIVYNGSATSSYNSGYRGSIKKIIIGNNTVSSTDYIFSKLSNLESIVIPKTFSFDYSFIFTNCYHLNTVIMPKKETNYSTPSRLVASTGIKKYILPDSINNIKANAFSGISTTKMYIPNTVTQIGGDGSAIFSYCLGLTKVTIPNSITSIGSSAFQEAHDIKIIDFTHNTQIPYLSSSSAFSSKGTDYEIWVPSSLYDSWIAASNWSSISSHIISK